jgi:hypothetical protein
LFEGDGHRVDKEIKIVPGSGKLEHSHQPESSEHLTDTA